MITQLYDELTTSLLRIVTGRLFTQDQIKKITDHSIGRYFKTIFPDDLDEAGRAAKLNAAKVHLDSASQIMTDMHTELDAQTASLQLLIEEIEEKKDTAEKFAQLAKTHENAARAMREEIRDAIGDELKEQSEDGRNIRRAASFVIWALTLIVGAALGAYFKDIVERLFA